MINLKQKNKNLVSDNRGVAGIEMVLILPILLFIILAVCEFGIYFLKSQIATRAVSNISNSIQQNPNDPSLQNVARQSGLSLLDLETMPNFICAKSYSSLARAQSGLCQGGDWDTASPSGVSTGVPYYVVVRAFNPYSSITPFDSLGGSLLPDIDQKTIIQVNTIQSPIIGAKIVTSVQPSWALGANWADGRGLSTFYAPKSDNSILKISFRYHFSMDDGNTARCHYYSRLAVNGNVVPATTTIEEYCATDRDVVSVFYVNSNTVGTSGATFAMQFKASTNGSGLPYGHNLHGIRNASAQANGVPQAAIEILEIQSE